MPLVLLVLISIFILLAVFLDFILENELHIKLLIFGFIPIIWIVLALLHPSTSDTVICKVHTTKENTTQIQYIIDGDKLINITKNVGKILPESSKIKVIKNIYSLGINFQANHKYVVIPNE